MVLTSQAILDLRSKIGSVVLIHGRFNDYFHELSKGESPEEFVLEFNLNEDINLANDEYYLAETAEVVTDHLLDSIGVQYHFEEWCRLNSGYIADQAKSLLGLSPEEIYKEGPNSRSFLIWSDKDV